ncbi:leukemia-associated protein 7 [Engraulis encrasicolus]|uniref:leukemia-associated protein 7 n=1 Tax=Engraulis encrasicolus TaxID=184585 RepID=UPI002FD1C0F6
MRTKNARVGATHGTIYGRHVCHGNSPSRPEGRKVMTIAQRARASMFARLMDILCQIIAIEEEMHAHPPRDRKLLPEFPKESIELKNICLRMAERDTTNSPSDRDLRDLQLCLKCISSNLLIVCNEHVSCSLFVTEKVKRLCDTFPEMW